MRSIQWKRFSRARARRQQKSVQQWKKFRRHRNRQVSTSSSPPPPFTYQRAAPVKTEVIKAPKVFSLLENYEETNKFFGDLLVHLRMSAEKEKAIFVEMAGVVKITIEAVVVLAALINRRKKRGIRVIGDAPKQEDAAALLYPPVFMSTYKAK